MQGVIERRAVLAALAVAGLMLGGAAQAQDTVRVGVVKVAGHAPVHVAEKLGYFKEAGVQVTQVQIRSGAEAQAAVIAGSLDLIGVNSISFILGLHEGFPFFAPVDGFNAPVDPPGTAGILVRTDNSVATPKDLEGKRLGIVTRKGLHELYLALWMKKHGIDPAKVRILEVPYPQMVDSLANNQVDAVIPLEPFITVGVNTGKVKVLAYYDSEIEPGHANGLWVGTDKWVKANPAAARKFAAAVYRAHAYLNQNPAERDKLVAEWTGLDAAVVGKMGKDVFRTSIAVDSIRQQARQMKELGWIQKDVDVAAAVWPTLP